MNPATLRARLAAPSEPLSVPPARTAPAGDDMHDLTPGPLKPAAVLVPFVLGPAPGVLLTKRTAHLSAHAGQVSFPGGRIDPEDASA